MGLPPQPPPPTPSSFSPFGPFATLHAAAPPGRDGSTADSFPFDDSRDEKQKEWILEIIKISDLVSEKAAQHDETCLAQVAEEEEGSAHNLEAGRPTRKGHSCLWQSQGIVALIHGVPLHTIIYKLIPKHIKEKFAAAFTKESVSEGAPLNSSGYGDSKMYALLVLPQSLRAGDGGSSSTGTTVGPFWLDSGSSYHYVGDDRILTNLRDPFLDSKGVTVADGSQLLVTKVGDIKTPDIEITDVYLVPGLKRCLVSVRQLAKIKIVTTFYEDKADLWLDGSWIGRAIIDDATLLYRLHFLRAPCLKEGGIGIRVGSSTMHMPKHCSVSEGAPLNSSGYGDSKMYALLALPQSPRAGDGGSSSTGTPVGPLWLDSGATHHFVGDDRILTNLRDPPAGMVITVANGSQLPVTKAGDITDKQTPDIEIKDVYLVPGLEMNLVSVRLLTKSKIVIIFYKNHADLLLQRSEIGGAIVDDAALLYRLRYLYDV